MSNNSTKLSGNGGGNGGGVNVVVPSANAKQNKNNALQAIIQEWTNKQNSNAGNKGRIQQDLNKHLANHPNTIGKIQEYRQAINYINKQIAAEQRTALAAVNQVKTAANSVGNTTTAMVNKGPSLIRVNAAINANINYAKALANMQKLLNIANKNKKTTKTNEKQ